VKEFRNKVAVITGAASGIGRGIADRCVEKGMRVVLADIDEMKLAKTEEELANTGADVVSIVTDVSNAHDVEQLAKRTIDVYGVVHLLFNNAGVGAGVSIWETSLADWEWVLGANLWGAIHGIRVFVPIMLSQDLECHVINTASIAGLITSYPCASYQVSKHALVGLSEQLYHSLAQRNAKVSVSVLCPGSVKTSILDSARNIDETTMQAFRQEIDAGISPHRVADSVFSAIVEKRFYILTHSEYDDAIRMRMECILRRENPAT
jgi:NAD(P)-dependent dehydrogenase (short-subunit alcohol dehydrogenase family)